jgi:tetratricopeptide (TPR) repeat protein
MKSVPVREAVADIARSAIERRLIIFAGAGVSMLAPSRSPSWWEIYAAAAQALAERFREGFPQYAADLDMDWLLRPLQTQQLSDLIVSRFAGETFVEHLGVVDIADPNENHMLIAALSAIGGIRGVVTTNFDTLFERAAVVRGISFRVATPFATETLAPAGAYTPLIKIHGSTVNPLKLVETSSHKARDVDPNLVESWRRFLADADLLVLGYSGADLKFGAARKFFSDFLASGMRIWWLHRPNSLPTLTEAVAARAELIEGNLPELLRDVAVVAGATGFAIPLSGADAQQALRGQMDRWSREGHIGKWSAAVFCYSLGRLHDDSLQRVAKYPNERFRNSPLQEALRKLGLEAAARCEPGSKFDVGDLGLGGFLSIAGLDAISHQEIAEAKQLLRAALNIFATTHRNLEGTRSDRSLSERHMNLSSAWNNYAHALLFDQADEAVAAFIKALTHAYYSGVTPSFLISLDNVLHFAFGNTAIRRCMQIAEGAIRIADRIGAGQSSIELRLRLAGYHVDRHELWAATREIQEARRRAVDVPDEPMVATIRILEAHILLRRGQLRAGLSEISKALTELGDRIHLSREMRAVWNTLDILAGGKSSRYMKLDAGDIERIASQAESEIATAERDNRLPWEGKLFSLHESACINQSDARALFDLGELEFGGNAEHTAGFALGLAKKYLTASYIRDASWVAGNALANPHVPPIGKALAHALLATAHAELDLLEDVEAHLEDAKALYRSDGQPVPLGVVTTGLWYSIQAGNLDKSIEWARQFVESITDVAATAALATTTVLQIDSWGEPMAPVARALRAAFSARFGWNLQARSSSPPSEAFRRFRGTNVELQSASDQKSHDIVHLAQELLSKGDGDGTLSKLDELTATKPLADHMAGVAVGLQIMAMGARLSAADIDRVVDAQRERMLGNLAFSALARTEASIARLATGNGDLTLATTVIAKRAFVADLCADPRAASTLRFWQAHLPGTVMGAAPGDAYVRAARLSARFYQTAESLFLDRDDSSPAERLKSPDTSRIVARYLTALQASVDSAQASKLLAEALADFEAAQALTPRIAARLRGDHANWALRSQYYQDAVNSYREVERDLRAVNDIEGALNALAGAARAASRSGDYKGAVESFERAIAEAGDHALRANLLTGLAAAHVIEGTEVRDATDYALLNKAIDTYELAIAATAVGELQRSNARLGLARALGEKGEKDAALGELDRAIAELAHLGSPLAKVLIENRSAFFEGQWKMLAVR